METFKFLSSDDGTNKKPSARKNINYVAGMMINTGDDEEYEHDDELNEGNVRNDDYELESGEEEEAGEGKRKGQGKMSKKTTMSGMTICMGSITHSMRVLVECNRMLKVEAVVILKMQVENKGQ